MYSIIVFLFSLRSKKKGKENPLANLPSTGSHVGIKSLEITCNIS